MCFHTFIKNEVTEGICCIKANRWLSNNKSVGRWKRVSKDDNILKVMTNLTIRSTHPLEIDQRNYHFCFAIALGVYHHHQTNRFTMKNIIWHEKWLFFSFTDLMIYFHNNNFFWKYTKDRSAFPSFHRYDNKGYCKILCIRALVY